jgi:hypothetical protein
VHFPIVAADELADFSSRSTTTASVGVCTRPTVVRKKPPVAAVEGRHGARAVDAHHPVGFGAAAGGIGQRAHLLVAAQVGKTVANGLWRHGLQPQALHGLAQGFFATGVLLDQPKDQLALAARVTGVDERGHVFALGQLHHGAQARLGFVDGLQIKVRRQHGQVGKAPLAALHVKFFGGGNFHQVAHGRRDHVAVVLKMVVMFLELARHGGQCANNVLSH